MFRNSQLTTLEIFMNDIEKARLISEAHTILDKIESNIHHIVESIKAKAKKAA